MENLLNVEKKKPQDLVQINLSSSTIIMSINRVLLSKIRSYIINNTLKTTILDNKEANNTKLITRNY